MEQIEKLARLVNMEPLLVVIIGIGIILILFGLVAFISARRRKRISRAKEKALNKAGNLEQTVSTSRKVNESFAAILTACQALPEGEAFLKKEEVASAIRELDKTLRPVPAPASKKKKKTRDLSLVDYSVQAAALPSGESARKSMVRIIRALYMDQALYTALQKDYSGELKKAAESLTE